MKITFHLTGVEVKSLYCWALFTFYISSLWSEGNLPSWCFLCSFTEHWSILMWSKRLPAQWFSKDVVFRGFNWKHVRLAFCFILFFWCGDIFGYTFYSSWLPWCSKEPTSKKKAKAAIPIIPLVHAVWAQARQLRDNFFFPVTKCLHPSVI